MASERALAYIDELSRRKGEDFQREWEEFIKENRLERLLEEFKETWKEFEVHAGRRIDEMPVSMVLREALYYGKMYCDQRNREYRDLVKKIKEREKEGL